MAITRHYTFGEIEVTSHFNSMESVKRFEQEVFDNGKRMVAENKRSRQKKKSTKQKEKRNKVRNQPKKQKTR